MLLRNKKIIIIAPLSSISKRVRLFKITKFMNAEGALEFTHVGWERIKGERVETALGFNLHKKIILRGGGYGGKMVKLLYLVWMIKIFFYGFSIRKDEVVWALGFESAYPLLLASKFKGFIIYFDDADRFSMLINLPYPLKKIVQKLEVLTSRKVYRHIIPVRERYHFASSKFFTLSNTPSKTELELARKIFNEKEWIKAEVVININGWLGKGRGMDTALKLYDALEGYNVGFILSGKLDCKEAEILSQRKNVQYLGKVSNAEALASYFASDFVFTYYSPEFAINKYAASNKWGDAIFTNNGIIVNSEVETAEYLRTQNVTISYSYEDYRALAEEIKKISLSSIFPREIKNNIESLSRDIPLFEDQLKKLFTYEA